jgi:tetratricopeptide (TPR) repeat protein
MRIVTKLELEPPDSFHVSSATGWLELGNPQEAELELGNVAPKYRSHPEVQEVQLEIYLKSQQWQKAAPLAQMLRDACPENAQYWIHLAYARRREPGGGIAAAKEVLVPARAQFPKEPIIAYNLACYDCQLGDLDAARKWFNEALKIGGKAPIIRMALADSDLEPLWPEILSKQAP